MPAHPQFRIFMRFTALLSLSGLLSLAAAKSAEDYFHAAANLYVQGRLQEAGNEVDQGLKENPSDPKLAGMNGLLKQLKDQQRKDQNQQGGGQNPNPESQKNQDKDKNQDGQNGNQPQPSPSDSSQSKDKKDGKESKPEAQKPEADTSQGSGQNQAKNEKTPRDSAQGGQADKPKPGQMSKEDAERLLNSFENDEKQSQHDRQAPRRQVDVEEDW